MHTSLMPLSGCLYSTGGGGGGGYSTDAWVGRCGPGVETLALFKTQFSDFTVPFKTECEIFRPYLRHLTQNHTLFKTRMK